MAVNVMNRNIFQLYKVNAKCLYNVNKLHTSSAFLCMDRGLVDQSHVFKAMDEARENDEKLDMESLRHISRLPKFTRKKLKHVDDPVTIEDLAWHPKANRPGFQRRLFAEQGRRSGVDPGICWPSLEELAEIKEKEARFEPSLQTMIEELEQEKAEEAEARRLKVEHIEQQLAKMPKYIADLQAKQQKREEEERKSKAKREALLQEAKEFFGYAIDSWDPRFKQMQEMKAEEEKKLKKKRKKEEKEKKKQFDKKI